MELLIKHGVMIPSTLETVLCYKAQAGNTATTKRSRTNDVLNGGYSRVVEKKTHPQFQNKTFS